MSSREISMQRAGVWGLSRRLTRNIKIEGNRIEAAEGSQQQHPGSGGQTNSAHILSSVSRKCPEIPSQPIRPVHEIQMADLI